MYLVSKINRQRKTQGFFYIPFAPSGPRVTLTHAKQLVYVEGGGRKNYSWEIMSSFFVVAKTSKHSWNWGYKHWKRIKTYCNEKIWILKSVLVVVVAVGVKNFFISWKIGFFDKKKRGPLNKKFFFSLYIKTDS